MALITQSNGPLAIERVEKFEAALGTRLPEQYRSFLQEFNGGRPVPKMFTISEEQGPDIIRMFFGIGNEYGNLEENYKVYEDRVPIGFVPIASDPGGNIICIGTDEEFTGKIYFWDHEEEPDDPEDMTNVYLLADSFNEFLEQLYASPEDLTVFIDENAEDDDFTGGVSDEEVGKIEAELDVVLPQSYRWFLTTYGSGGLYGSDILGCEKSSVHRVVSVTAKLRQDGLPSTYIVIEDCGEFYYCLDLSDCSAGECSIISWSKAAGFSGKRADTFCDFLLTRFTEAKEVWDEDI